LICNRNGVVSLFLNKLIDLRRVCQDWVAHSGENSMPRSCIYAIRNVSYSLSVANAVIGTVNENSYHILPSLSPPPSLIGCFTAA
jgi:hypothetical protein